MEYKACISPCAKTCQSLNINEVCHGQCIDGCSCPGNLFTGLFTGKRLTMLLHTLLEERNVSFLKYSWNHFSFWGSSPRISQFLYCLNTPWKGHFLRPNCNVTWTSVLPNPLRLPFILGEQLHTIVMSRFLLNCFSLEIRGRKKNRIYWMCFIKSITYRNCFAFLKVFRVVDEWFYLLLNPSWRRFDWLKGGIPMTAFFFFCLPSLFTVLNITAGGELDSWLPLLSSLLLFLNRATSLFQTSNVDSIWVCWGIIYCLVLRYKIWLNFVGCVIWFPEQGSDDD